MNEVTRFLVDKKLVEIDGKEHYKLYFYDAMDGVVVTIVAPVVVPQMDKEKESIEEQAPTINPHEISDEELFAQNLNISGGHI